MPNYILDFWSKFDPYGAGPHLHPDDLEWFKENKWDIQRQAAESFDGFVKGGRLGADVDRQPHLSLLPSPFHGNISEAKIFILLMNPGFTTSDYYAEEDPAFRAASISNLLQNHPNVEFPYFSLDPKFAWSGAYQWAESRLRPILQRLKKERHCTYYEALAFLSKQIAVIELIPYHSSNGQVFSGRGNPWKNLPSAMAARQFVRRLCQSPRQPLIIVARSHKKWDIPDQVRPNVVICPHTRGLTFNPKLPKESGKAGRKILEYLGYPPLTR